jgi:hypothetical protein
MAALTWSISRFKKDGLGNASNQFDLPDFLKFVGVLKCSHSAKARIAIPCHFRQSSIEQQFFSNVLFYELRGSIEKDEHLVTDSGYAGGEKCILYAEDLSPEFKRLLADAINLVERHHFLEQSHSTALAAVFILAVTRKRD